MNNLPTSQSQLVTLKANSERIEKAQGELFNLRSQFNTFGRELVTQFKELPEQIRKQYTEHVTNSSLAFKTKLEVKLNSNVQQAIHNVQDAFRHELDKAVAMKNYVTNDRIQDKINHLSQSSQVRIAELTSMWETKCSKLQGNLDGLATETCDKIVNDLRNAEKNFCNLESRASHLENHMKNYPQVNLKEENQIVLAGSIDHKQIMRANAEQIERELHRRDLRFQ
ncbi:uncharacterized protein PGTG_22045 [Puccinia graminis f. sp. tritici CRL 75-36-700-3]|uniref:Uncharacterized protein n=1 Tax=Puccinia graminis f. sp. tritici (strain CRL 75-36-700-3 / race SCCL) TaxID=418459 RepID=H6QTH3_PUCGT|nr:uncharacterized protein PGTG_22045 [Puccinia graminis f. sp. tritici CRL 75-36-700-3]EHS64188.1 hypothetical protein PGTG_22045 [Puccinia graminis f. sp. tritici CRL 75-36-700-3]